MVSKNIENKACRTDVNAIEMNGVIIETLNASAPENLVKTMKRANGLLSHVSTDCEFSGEPYKENEKGL